MYEFLVKQVESLSSSEYCTASSQLVTLSRAESEQKVGPSLSARCEGCGTEETTTKYCLSCGQEECRTCLCRDWDWTEDELERQAWVCVLCSEKEEAEVTSESLVLFHLKTGHFPLGLTTAGKTRIKKSNKKYRWNEELQMVMKVTTKKYGERVIPLPEEREAIICGVHKYGHLGINRIAGAVVSNYYWRGIYRDVKKVIHHCPCAANKRKVTAVRPLQPTLIPLGPFDLVAVDLMTLTMSYQGNRYLITAQDYFSKWPEAKAVPHKSAQAVAVFIDEYIFSRFGCPIEIVTDQGREFLGEVNLLLTHGLVIHRTTSAYRAQTNGLVEHLNGVLGRSLAATLEKGDLRTWEKGLRDFLVGYRGLKHASTGKSPHQILMFRPMRLPWKYNAMPRPAIPDN